jgi:uncharacterized membrane protein
MDAVAPAFLEGLSTLDLAALAVFFVAWLGYTWAADRGPMAERSITRRMNRFRLAWARSIPTREVRVGDTAAVGNFLTGISLFASTSILMIGGLVALLGAGEEAMRAIEALSFVPSTTLAAWELKILLLVAIFIYAFFKFAWAFRLSNYASILVGAAPLVTGEWTEEAEIHARRIARMVALVAFHLNRGLRAYFFALAALAWFIHPVGLMVATLLVLRVLYRREFRSRALRTLLDPSPPLPPATDPP